ncbi:MAG: KAP family NTPase [Lachnospiraceae bacterium]|nr:KAP family NTPase [Lachnospiraceae bacterium]
MKSNPFNLTFGKEPSKMISRFLQSNEILDAFRADDPSQQIYMITGVRGCGKTVFMNSIARTLESDDNWIVAELNSSDDMMRELAAKLYNAKGMTGKYKTAGINLSFWGIGINIKKSEPITDLGTAIELMLEHIDRSGKRVLITIDEVVNNREMRVFAGAFQILVRHQLPLFLLMTGLYENINRLQNEENLTFLYRAPKVYLPSLNLSRISDVYEKTLGIDAPKAGELAKKTKGYSFAFQVIGYFTFSHEGDYESALADIRQYLDEYVYEKIWSETSDKERLILSKMVYDDITAVGELKDTLELKPNEFSVYRDRLIKKGVLDGSRRGILNFALPYFDEYIREHTDRD